MQVRKHPLSEKWIVRYFVIVFVTLSAAIVLPLVLADHGFGAVLDRIGIYYVFGLFALFIGCFIRLHYRLLNQTCPECGGRTVTRSRSAELPNAWSARCDRCAIIWDLGIGNSD